ncbi:septin-2 [Cricetulus griseus]|nr:septin-2 [Cricetulus griseus]
MTSPARIALISIFCLAEQCACYLHDERALHERPIPDDSAHCSFFFISLLGVDKKPLDVAFMKLTHSEVNDVPVIVKADMLTLREREQLENRTWDETETHNIKICHLMQNQMKI